MHVARSLSRVRAFALVALGLLLAGCSTPPPADLPPPPSEDCRERELWRVELPRASGGRVASDADRFVIAEGDEGLTNVTLVRLDGSGVAWTTRVEGWPLASVALAGPVVIVEMTVFDETGHGRGLVGLHERNGTEIWRFDAPETVPFASFEVLSPPEGSGSPVVLYTSHKLWANEPVSAASVWTWVSEGEIMDIVKDGDMLFAHVWDHSYDLVALDMASGAELWRANVRNFGDLTFEEDAVVWDSTAGLVRRVRTFDRASGAELASEEDVPHWWRYHNLTHDVNASFDAIVTSHDRHTRAPLWSFEAERSSEFHDQGFIPGNVGYGAPDVYRVGDDVLVEARNETVGPYRPFEVGLEIHERWWMLDGATGHARWERRVEHAERMLGLRDGLVVFAGPDRLTAVDAQSGEIAWACTTDGYPEVHAGALLVRSSSFLARLP